MKNFFVGILSFLGLWSAPAVVVPPPPEPVVQYVPVPTPAPASRDAEIDALIQEVKKLQAERLGATTNAVLPIAGATYALSGAGVSNTATSFTLASLTLPQTGQKLVDADFSDTFYVTLEPGNTTRQELVSCTTVVQNSAGTATLSGCSRGLSPITPYTASSSLRFSHGGGTKVIFSDPPQFFNRFAAFDNNGTTTGAWAFSPTSTPGYTIGMGLAAQYGSSSQFTSKLYVDNTNNTGAATADTSTLGLCEIATRTEIASSTDLANPLCVESINATSTPGGNIHTGSGNTYVVVSEDDGYINQTWVDLSEGYTWTGNQILTRSTTTNATTTSLSVTGTASTSRLIATNGIGVGNVSTSTRGNAVVENYLQVDGTASTSALIIGNSCVGCFKYTGSTSPLALSTASRNMGGTQSEINFGIGSYTITDSSSAVCNERGTFFVARAGITSIDIGGMDGSSDGACDGQYTIAFDTSITETTDAGTDSSLAGTIYWFR